MTWPRRPIRDRLPQDLANYLDQEQGVTKSTEPKTNVFGSAWLRLTDYLSERDNPVLRWGQVIDFVPLHNAYRVQAEYGGVFICTLGSLTGFQPSGSRQGNTLPLGTSVLFTMPVQSSYGVIIGTDPGYITDGRNLRNDFIVQGGNTGLYADDAHDALLSKLADNGGIGCFSGGRPMDSTSAGEMHFSTETGLALHQDPFLSYLRVDEETGLFLFYHDQLTRLAGHNLEFRSVLGDHEQLDDQQESVLIQGRTPYPWERLGSFSWGQQNYTERDQDIIQSTHPEYSVLEPGFDDQQPYYRSTEYEGYLGQGKKRLISLPPYPAPTNANRYSDQSKYVGVLNIQEALDGSYGIQSAKRIYITKRSSIPVPKMVIRPEDQTGDTELNYKAAGRFGLGEAHVLNSQFTSPGAEPELVRASSVLDLGAFMFNWQGVHPFHYHRKDWYLPEECDISLSICQQPVSFCDLKSQQYLSAPAPVSLPVDHRFGANAKYYPNESFIVLLEDGGIVIGDGFGFELKATAGNVDISAPGDINLRPGKNLNIWAGWDATVRANNSADITATNRDVRIKAERNVQILGGNDKYSGVIIESKADCPSYDFDSIGQAAQHSGITFIAKKSPIISYGSDLVFQSVVGSSSASGNITFTAGNTQERDVKFYCKNIMNFLGTGKMDFFAGGTANEYNSTHTLLGSALRVTGKTTLLQSLLVNDWIRVVGHISTTLANSYGGLVAKFTDTTTAATEVANTGARESYLVTFGTNNSKPAYEATLDTNLKKGQFSLRVLADYKTSGYVYFETRWQQMARITNNIPAKWTEKSVDTTGGLTYPYPGKEVLTGNAWSTQDFTLYNPQRGGSINREANQGAYETPEHGATNTTTLNGNYPVIMNC